MAVPIDQIVVVEEWSEFGHHFKITNEKTIRSGMTRNFRLYDNGRPALGGQWHFTVEGAKSRAGFLLQSSYSDRIAWLERRVNELESKAYGI